MDGTLLAAMYAYPPNRLGYCGRAPFRKALSESLRRGRATPGLRAELGRFHAHGAYLSLIAERTGLEPFDMRVVRAFWTGSPLLERVGREDLGAFIAHSLFKGRQRGRAGRLGANLPAGAVPHHSFNALYVNFVNPDVGGSIGNIDSCCVTAARIASVSGRRALAEREAIVRAKGGYGLAKRRCFIDLERGGMRFLGRPKPGDTVSVHWGMAIERLKRRDASALRRYTLKNIRAVSCAGCRRAIR